MRSGYDMGGGEEHISTGYSQNKVFKIAPKQTVYSALSIISRIPMKRYAYVAKSKVNPKNSKLSINNKTRP